MSSRAKYTTTIPLLSIVVKGTFVLQVHQEQGQKGQRLDFPDKKNKGTTKKKDNKETRPNLSFISRCSRCIIKIEYTGKKCVQ